MKARLLACIICSAVAWTCSAADSPAHKWNFEDASIGALPTGWVKGKTGTGPGSVWQVGTDSTSPHGPKTLVQTSTEGPNPLFNLCVAEGALYGDVNLTVAFKAISGEKDQGGGPVWRYQDANNYYVARFNPLEDNYRLYKVVGGKRKQLATADAEAVAGKWHTLRVVHQGEQIKCYLNGKLHIEVRDTEIAKAGKIGLWTKADAVTAFDGLTVSTAK